MFFLCHFLLKFSTIFCEIKFVPFVFFSWKIQPIIISIIIFIFWYMSKLYFNGSVKSHVHNNIVSGDRLKLQPWCLCLLLSVLRSFVQDTVDVRSRPPLVIALRRQHRLCHISSPRPLYLQIMFSVFTVVSVLHCSRFSVVVNKILWEVWFATSMEEYHLFTLLVF